MRIFELWTGMWSRKLYQHNAADTPQLLYT